MVRVYCICLDGAPPNLLVRFARDGTMPNLGKILSEASWSRALPSIPTVTSVNWTTMVTGLHGGTHGRPYSNQQVRYFWEAAEEKGIRVGLANIEHNELRGSSFYVEHAKVIADAATMKVNSGDAGSFPIKTQDGAEIAEARFEISDHLRLEIQGFTTARIRARRDEMSDYALFRVNDHERTPVCTRARYDSGGSTLYISPLRSTQRFADPPGIEGHLISIAGPPPVRGFPLFHRGVADLNVAIEEEAYHARWFGKVAAHEMGASEDGLWFHRHNTTDGVGHFYLGLVDPGARAYDPSSLEANWSALRRWYSTVDSIFEEILKADPEARFAMCTDHGNIGFSRIVSVGKLLVDSGLAKPNPESPHILDQRASAAFLSSNEIFINSSHAPGADASYEAIRSRIIELLRSLVDPSTSRHVVSLAVRREEASALLYWGKARGDILYFLEPGYLCPGPYVMEEVFRDAPVPKHGAEHFGCLPGYEDDIGSTYSFMAFSGYPGGERDVGALGPVHLVDFAPTVLAMMGMCAPWLQGRVLWEMIKEPSEHDRTWKPKPVLERRVEAEGKETWAAQAPRHRQDAGDENTREGG